MAAPPRMLGRPLPNGLKAKPARGAKLFQESERPANGNPGSPENCIPGNALGYTCVLIPFSERSGANASTWPYSSPPAEDGWKRSPKISVKRDVALTLSCPDIA